MLKCSKTRALLLEGVVADLEDGNFSLMVGDAEVPKSIVAGMRQDLDGMRTAINMETPLKYTFAKPLEKPKAIETVFSSYYRNYEVYRASSIIIINKNNENFVIVGNQDNVPSIFNVAGKFIGRLGSYSSSDGLTKFYGSNAIAVDAKSETIAIASTYSETVEIYELKYSADSIVLGEKIGRIGSWRSSGHPFDGKLSNPNGLVFLENGNLLIGCEYGYTKQDGEIVRRNGHVSEFKKDGTFVKTHLGNHTDGKPWNGQINEVSAMKKSGEFIFVSSYGDYVAIYKLVNSSLEYVTTVTNDTGIGNVNPRGVCMKENHLYITLGNLAQIVIVDLETLKIIKVIGKPEFDDKVNASNNLNSFWDVRDIEYYGDGKFLVADYGNKRVSIMQEVDAKVLYDVPNDVGEIVYSSKEIDADNRVLVEDTTRFEDVFICYKKK